MRLFSFLLSCLLMLSANMFAQEYDPDNVSLSEDEEALYELLMNYRAQYNLPSIPVSKALTFVAQTHCKDVYEHYSEFPAGCGNHSWSAHGSWSRCDYYRDGRNAKGAWVKPSELTDYKSNGYEIVTSFTPPPAGVMTPSAALKSWQGSTPHRNTILNQGIWVDNTWKSIGVGMYKGVAAVWFGEE